MCSFWSLFFSKDSMRKRLIVDLAYPCSWRADLWTRVWFGDSIGSSLAAPYRTLLLALLHCQGCPLSYFLKNLNFTINYLPLFANSGKNCSFPLLGSFAPESVPLSTQPQCYCCLDRTLHYYRCKNLFSSSFWWLWTPALAGWSLRRVHCWECFAILEFSPWCASRKRGHTSCRSRLACFGATVKFEYFKGTYHLVQKGKERSEFFEFTCEIHILASQLEVSLAFKLVL